MTGQIRSQNNGTHQRFLSGNDDLMILKPSSVPCGLSLKNVYVRRWSQVSQPLHVYGSTLRVIAEHLYVRQPQPHHRAKAYGGSACAPVASDDEVDVRPKEKTRPTMREILSQKPPNPPRRAAGNSLFGGDRTGRNTAG